MTTLWDERNMTDIYPNVSPYLLRPLRGICQSCKERIARAETELCEICEQNVQADVVDLDAADFRKWGG